MSQPREADLPPDLEARVRQMRRTRPLETCEIEVGPGIVVTAPTAEESLRVKAYLIVQRNQVRDYLDVVALADFIGTDRSTAVLARIDDYYVDRSQDGDSVLTSLVLRLAEPAPRDEDATRQLADYKGLAVRWHEWDGVVEACRELALRIDEAES